MPLLQKTPRKLTIRPLPRAAYITICVLPAALTILFYALRPSIGVMDFVTFRIAAPVRMFLGRITSLFPFSVMEVLLTILGIFAIYYIAQTVKAAVRGRGRRVKIILKRLLHITVLALYIWSAFCWMWNTGYFARGFAERNNIVFQGAATSELTDLTWKFLGRANELAPQMRRDSDGRFAENRREMFDAYGDIFANLAQEFPELGGRVVRPKPMIYSWLMSRTGYSGIYFALTGEAHINTQMPGHIIPFTIAHELAHHLGVFAEDEANFVAIIAAISSDNIVYQYSGYYFGLMYLLTALHRVDYNAWQAVRREFAPELYRDWSDNYYFWQSQRTVDTGVTIVDRILTAATETLHETVNNVYDGFLRANNQELGLQSYGACVDLLLAYFMQRPWQ